MRPRTPSSCRGASLLEVLIATTVLTVSSMGAFGAMVSARKLQDSALERDLARQELTATMDRLLALPVDDLAGGDPQFTEGAQLQLATDALDAATLTFRRPGYADGDPVPVTLQVELELAWTSAAGGTSTARLAGAKRRVTP